MGRNAREALTVYTNGNDLGTYTVGELGFGIKKLAKRVRKVAKKVPGVRLVGKIGEKVLKPIAKPLRPVIARVAPVASGGLIKPKWLGIQSAKSQAAYRQVGKFVRTAAMPTVAVQRALLKKAMTSKVVTSEARPFVTTPTPTMTIMPVGPSAPLSLLPSAPESGWTDGGGGGGGAAGGGAEPSPMPEEPPPGEVGLKPTQAGMAPGLTFILLSAAFYTAYKLTQPKRGRRR